MTERLWEIDALRGISLILMLFSNFLSDLSIFGIADYAFNFWLARFSAFLFIFISGISLHLSYIKAKKADSATFLKFLKRGILLFSLGLLITLATFLFLKEGFVLFGILHFLGFSVILGYFILKLDARQVIAASAIFFAAGILLEGMRFSFPWLLWLGFIPYDFYSFDYFPLLPWFSFFALGIAFGKVFYKEHKSKIRMPCFLAGSVAARTASFLGRHTLLIYLVHQPLLISAIYFVFPQNVFSVIRVPF